MTNVSGGGFQFQKCSGTGTWTWSVVSQNVSCGGSFFVTDVLTPYGKFTDVSVPIPADIVLAMAESIVQFETQLIPKLVLLDPAHGPYKLTITEGSPIQTAGMVGVVNAGALGSSMMASASASVPWLFAQPPTIASLGKNQSGVFSIFIRPDITVAAPTPYLATVNFQDNAPAPNLVQVTFEVTVLPRPSISTVPASLHFYYYLSSGSSSGPQVIAVSNNGPSSSALTFRVGKVLCQSPWLLISPVAGGPLDSGQTVSVNFSLDLDRIPQIQGLYNEIVYVVSSDAANSPAPLSIMLEVLT